LEITTKSLSCHMTDVSKDNVHVPLAENEAAVVDAYDNEAEVTKFTSEAPAVQTAMESVRLPPTISYAPKDAELGTFLRRPVQIHAITWTAEAASLNTHFDPWSEWMNTTSVNRKFANFEYLRGNLHLKFQINGTMQHYGRMMLSYQPSLGRTLSPPTGPFPNQSHSSLSHVLLDPSTNAEGRMVCPFITPFTWINTSSQTSQWIGRVFVDQLAPLSISTGTLTTDLIILVYAWLEDAEMAYPSDGTIPVYTNQSSESKPDEYSATDGAISKPANVNRGIAAHLSDFPVIGSFARATEMGAGTMSHLASLFGFSRPRMIKPAHRVIVQPGGQMAVCDEQDSAVPLSVSTKAELTIDPAVHGEADCEDNMAIHTIARKWALTNTFQWDASNVTDDILFYAGISPLTLTQTVGDFVQYTPMGFASLPFRNWRGSIEVRIQVVASRFMRGRLRIAWAPDGIPVTNAEINTNYGRIIDISQSCEYELIIPYARNTGYLYNRVPASYDNDAYNGAIYVSVQNALITPAVTQKNIRVLVWIRAGPDFEVAVPTSHEYGRLAPWYSNQSSEGMPLLDQGVAQEVKREALWEHVTHPEVNSVFVGDPVRSFRSVLKRYEDILRMPIANILENGNNILTQNSDGIVCFNLPYYPPPAGVTADGYGSGKQGATFYDYNVNRTSLMSYLSFAFVGFKGSVRWMVNNPFRPNGQGGDDLTCSKLWVDRAYGGSLTDGTPLVMPFFGVAQREYVHAQGMTGAEAYMDPAHDPIAGTQWYSPDTTAVHFEVPGYNQGRFFGFQGNEGAGTVDRRFIPDGCMLVKFNLRNSTTSGIPLKGYMFTAAVAAGEDYTYVGWAGVPPLSKVNNLPGVASQHQNGIPTSFV
jgi:hypothetical protein